MQHIDTVIFDLDGTLIDSMGYWLSVDQEYLSRRNIKRPSDLILDHKSGNSFLEMAEYFKKRFSLPDTTEEITNEWIEIVGAHYQTDIKTKPGAQELLDYLKSNYFKIGLGTSNSIELAKTVLKANSILDYFQTIVTGCRKIKGKPYPDIFLQAAKNIGSEPDSCIVIEDTLVGVKAAKNAGMLAIAIEDKYATEDREEIKQFSDFYALDFYEAKDYIIKEIIIKQTQ